jgi:hypothetical protein
MATAADIIKGALRRLQVIGSETPIEADEIQDGLEDLNDFGSSHEVGFLQLGFSSLSSQSDSVSIPEGAIGYFKDALALYIAGQYGAPIPQSLVMSHEKTKAAALNAFQPVINVEFPDTLPIGSGNNCDLNIEDQRYFTPNSTENF